MSIKYSVAVLLCLLSVFSLYAQDNTSGTGQVKRTIAVTWEEDIPEVRLLASSIAAELVNSDSVTYTGNQDKCDAVLYAGLLEFGSRSSLWVRGIDRFTDEEVFTETWIYQKFSLEEMSKDFLPRVIQAVIKGFPAMDSAVAAAVQGIGKEELVFTPPVLEAEPVTLTLIVPEGSRLILKSGVLEAGAEGEIPVRAIPGALLPYRLEAPGYVPDTGEILVGNEDETRIPDLTPYASWALELKGRLWEFGIIPGYIKYLQDEEIYFYADLEQNIISLKNLFTFYSDAQRGFIQPVIGMGSYGLPADSLFRPYLGFGVFTRFVFGEEEPLYLSKTITWGIDLPMGLEFDPFKGENFSIIFEYTPRIFYSSFYDAPFEDFFVSDTPLPAHIFDHWHLQYAGPLNIGVRWEL